MFSIKEEKEIISMIEADLSNMPESENKGFTFRLNTLKKLANEIQVLIDKIEVNNMEGEIKDLINTKTTILCKGISKLFSDIYGGKLNSCFEKVTACTMCE
jgi:hypothetical protein